MSDTMVAATARRCETRAGNASGEIPERHEIAQLFCAAQALDASVNFQQKQIKALERIRILPNRFSRHRWLTHMSEGEILLCGHYPSPMRQGEGVPDAVDKADILQVLSKWRPRRSFYIQTGPSGAKKYLKFPEIYRRWSGSRAIVSATDIHIRGTTFGKVLDLDLLTHINLLPAMPGDAASLEMLSIVISSAGNLTDSHTDDVDGSNYCFTGKKLWLAWDTQEGLNAGLEDCDRSSVYTRAKFDMETFLSLKSACWFTVEPGQMLFMPGNMAHKVFTLERYVGVGGFYITLPNVLRTLARWEKYLPNWEINQQYGDDDSIRHEVADHVRKVIGESDRQTLNHLGAKYMANSKAALLKNHSRRDLAELPLTSELLGLF